MIMISRLEWMSTPKQAEAVSIVEEKLHILLTQHGPLSVDTIKYLLDTRQHVTIGRQDLLDVLGRVNPEVFEERTFRSPRGNKITHFTLRNDTRDPSFPVISDYPEAYHVLLARYQAIRNNPSLTDMAEEYIDSLYNPATADTEGFRIL